MKEYEPTNSSKTTDWLEERQRPGNWFDVAESDEIPADLIVWRRTFLHMFQVAFAPEIRGEVLNLLEKGRGCILG